MKKLFELLKGDRALWIVVILLSFIGVVEVFSSTATLGYKYKDGNTFFHLIKHLSFVVIGFIIMFVTSRISYKRTFKIAGPFLWFSAALLLITLFSGNDTNNARRWIEIPLVGLSFQTSDLAKLALMLYLAKTISQAKDDANETEKKNVFKQCIIAVGAICLLILPANFSTAFLVGVTSLVVLYIGRVKIKWLLMTVGAAVVLFGFFVAVTQLSGSQSRVGTWSKRIETFFSSDSDGSGANFQTEQAKIAIASGGITGKGIGKSQQRTVLPHPYSDFIYAEIVEECGLVGAIGIVILYLVFFYRCIAIIRDSDRTYPAFVVLGFSLNIIFQAVANMLVAVHITPVTGQPLPFVSMGGTSLIFTSISTGIILNISRYAGKKETVEEIEDEMEEEELTDYPFITG